MPTIIGNQISQQFQINTQWPETAYGLVYLPKDFDPKKRYSLCYFGHGAGEGGDGEGGLWNLTRQGLPFYIANDLNYSTDCINPKTKQKEQFIVVAVQAPSAAHWSFQYGQFLAILPDILSKYPIDPNKIHFTGLSAGAAGAISVATHGPEFAKKIASIVCVSTAGVNDVSENAELVNIGKYGVKVWHICGEKDSHLTLARQQVDDINKGTPNTAILTIIKGADHEPAAWNPPYSQTWKTFPDNQLTLSIFEFMSMNNRTDALDTSTGTWQKIADEGSIMNIDKPCTIRYGANGKYITKQFDKPAMVYANNTTFGGDPAVGVKKTADIFIPGDTPPPPPPPSNDPTVVQEIIIQIMSDGTKRIKP
jgi:hypothetical protein